ncbi:hypothetical protein BHE74_00003767 [Ensete ventricosum]|nr:hypothetical protein BHE74_00003767 [Ensete ventricosum]
MFRVRKRSVSLVTLLILSSGRRGNKGAEDAATCLVKIAAHTLQPAPRRRRKTPICRLPRVQTREGRRETEPCTAKPCGTTLVNRPPCGAVGGAAFLDAWRKVAAPNIDPPKTLLGFMESRPPTPSLIPSKLTGNFVLPYRSEISNKEVCLLLRSPADPSNSCLGLIWSLYQQLQGKRVFCLDMLPPLQRLKPGVLQVHKGNEITKYFVSSGFASIHANSVTDIVAVEVVPVDHIDPSLVQKGLAVYT